MLITKLKQHVLKIRRIYNVIGMWINVKILQNVINYLYLFNLIVNVDNIYQNVQLEDKEVV